MPKHSYLMRFSILKDFLLSNSKLNKKTLPFRFQALFHSVKPFFTAGFHPSEAENDYSHPWALLHPVYTSFLAHIIYYCIYFITMSISYNQTVNSLKFKGCNSSTFVFPAPGTDLHIVVIKYMISK